MRHTAALCQVKSIQDTRYRVIHALFEDFSGF